MSVQVNWMKGRWEVYVRPFCDPGHIALKTRSLKKMLETINEYSRHGAKVHHVLVSQ